MPGVEAGSGAVGIISRNSDGAEGLIEPGTLNIIP